MAVQTANSVHHFRAIRATYTSPVQQTLDVSNAVAAELAGISDGVLDALKERLHCTVRLRGNQLTLEGDDSHLKGPLRIAGKDLRFYARLAEQAPAAAFIAQAVNQTLHLFNTRGHGERFLPVLPGLIAELNGAKIRDL